MNNPYSLQELKGRIRREFANVSRQAFHQFFRKISAGAMLEVGTSKCSYE
jgi:hypothetical protein